MLACSLTGSTIRRLASLRFHRRTDRLGRTLSLAGRTAARGFVSGACSGLLVTPMKMRLAQESDTIYMSSERLEAVVSISVAAEHRGRGVARRLLQLSARRLFAECGIRRIHAFVRPEKRVILPGPAGRSRLYRNAAARPTARGLKPARHYMLVAGIIQHGRPTSVNRADSDCRPKDRAPDGRFMSSPNYRPIITSSSTRRWRWCAPRRIVVPTP